MDVLSTGQPIFAALKTLVVGTNGTLTASITQFQLPDPNSAGYTGLSPLDNLNWFMVIPYAGGALADSHIEGISPTSGPSLIGDTLYFGAIQKSSNGSRTALVSVDLRGFSGQHNVFVGGYPRVHELLKNSDPLLGGNAPILEPPTGTEQTLVVGLPQGLVALDARPTVIADGSRLLEVDYGVNAIWTADGTARIAPSGTNGVSAVLNKSPLSRPSVVHRVGNNQFVVADTNNNRVTLLDRGGNVLWEMNHFDSTLGVLPAGSPSTLNAPTDVEFFEDSAITINGTTYNGIIDHYLIADSGNYRALEIVDIFDNSGTLVKSRELAFVTNSLAEQNSRLRYRTIQEFTLNTASGTQTFLAAAVSNVGRGTVDAQAVTANQSGTKQEGIGGSIVIIDRSTGGFRSVVTTLYDRTGTQSIAISNPVWFKEISVPDPSNPGSQIAHYLLADDNGCFEFGVDPATHKAIVVWRLLASEYRALAGRPLQASSIQRLTQADFYNGAWYPRFLITNRYDGPDYLPELFGTASFTDANGNVVKTQQLSGTLQRGQIHGEVFEIRGADYIRNNFQYVGANSGLIYNFGGARGTRAQLTLNPKSPIVWLCPKETIVPFQVGQSSTIHYRIERSIGSPDGATSTYTLQGSSFAERPQ